NITDRESLLKQTPWTEQRETLLDAKQLGVCDRQIASLKGITEEEVRVTRAGLGITPFVKQIDTLAAEYPAQTNYLYVTYNALEDDLTDRKSTRLNSSH